MTAATRAFRRWGAAVTPPARRIDYPRHGRRGVRRWIPSWRLVLGTALTGVGALLGLFALVYAQVDIPSENAQARQESNVYYWADGSHMVSVGAVNRRNVPLSEVPAPVRDAAIAAENAGFYSDSGVSFGGLGRAVSNMARGRETQGGSTITQQYVKNTYLSQEQTLSRKVKEFCLALKLDNRTSKDEILQGYLNTSWFGRGAYGIQAASNAYYGMDVDELDPSQGAFLAALLKGGNAYDPVLSPANRRRAVERWSWILDRQVELGMMDAAKRARYTRFPQPLARSLSTALSGQTGYLVDLAERYVKKRTGLTDAELDRGGYQIHTTFEKDAVGKLERSVRDVLRRGLNPEGRKEDRHAQVGAASVRPVDGAVVAVYGGPDATEHFTNNADTSGVPAGSVFKPFVLAAALQHGVRREDGSALSVSAESFYAESGELTGSAPALDGPGFPPPPAPYGHVPTTLRMAAVLSSNAIFRRLGDDVGLRRVEDMAVGAGMLRSSMARRDEEFPLGTSSPSAIRVATSYATFANGGIKNEPYSVTRVIRDGTPLAGLERPRGTRAMDEAVARGVTSVFQGAGVLGPGTAKGTAAPAPVRPAAGMGVSTNQNETQRAAWFAGHSGELATAVTLFRSEPGKPLLSLAGVGREESTRGSLYTTRIWSAYMRAVSAGSSAGTP
ncbi:transglycosylase domain-containing protein [Streptomyces sp. NPDC088755]|uniref:transglycosylase domain-containing protein n=1 Tax=Streptomyces sp. NPDC088755 TaxID=3365888 RepID=UPI00382AE3DE